MVTGDLNYDCLEPSKSKTLIDICDIFDLTNMVKSATCFMKNCNPSLVDVILTNKPRFFFNAVNFGCDISDWHNLIGVVVKGATARVEKRRINYRSYKKFEEKEFNDDVGRIPFHAAYVFDDVDDIYWAHELLLTGVINEHAPIKERETKVRKPAYMNGNLRRAVFKKHMLFNKYKKGKTSADWELYRKQRNYVTKLKKASMRVYFYERCAGGPKSKDFWPTIKPFLSKKGSDGGSEVILNENDQVISDQAEACTVFNTFFFANVAKNIGKDCQITNLKEHPSIQMISENLHSNTEKFSFRLVSDSEVMKILSKNDPKKSTGVDISGKIIKSCTSSIQGTVANLINITFHKCQFPASSKGAQVVPLHKKNDPLDKENYRPVSILPIISKVYERAMHNQLSEFFDNIFHPYLAAFCKGFGCQSTLLCFLEDWRKALDNHQFAVAILMDLSKAFNCLPHDLLIEKLRAYGLAPDDVSLLSSYLSDRVQQVRLGSHTSTWEKIIKGVPQGSILGPLLFNVFINIFYFVKQAVIYNYADDNTLSFIHNNLVVLKKVLEEESCILIDCFFFFKNFMKAYPTKDLQTLRPHYHLVP